MDYITIACHLQYIVLMEFVHILYIVGDLTFDTAPFVGYEIILLFKYHRSISEVNIV